MAKTTAKPAANAKNAKSATTKSAAKPATKPAAKTVETDESSSFTTDSLVRAISKKSEDSEGKATISLTQAGEIVGYFKDSVAEALAEGKKVQLTGFFTITPSYRESHEGNNVMTGEKMTIPASVVFNAKVGKGLKDVAKDLPASVIKSLKAAKDAKDAGK